MPGLNVSPEIKFVLLLIHAADPERREMLLTVLHTFIRDTGTQFMVDVQDPANAHRLPNLTKQLYPYSLRTAMRGFICSLLCGLYGLLFDGSDEARVIRAQLDTYLNFATYDVRARSKLSAGMYTPPADAGEGCKKVWTYVNHTFPDVAKFDNELDPEGPEDPVKSAPIKWDSAKVETFLGFALVILDERRATGKVRKAPKGLYSLPRALVEYLPAGVVAILRAKGDFSRFGKIAPPCPRGLQTHLPATLAGILYLTYPGGEKKSGDIENPFGTAKGYDETKRKARAAMNKSRRHAAQKLAAEEGVEAGVAVSLLDGALAKLGRKRRAPEPPVAQAIAEVVPIDGGDKKRSANVFVEVMEMLCARKALAALAQSGTAAK